jgi:twitching motility protein PilI
MDNVAMMPTPTEALRAGIDAAAAQAAAASASPVRAATSQRQGFRIGSVHLMVRYEDGSELAEVPGVCRLPHSPAWFLGMTNLHGGLVPVFDLARKWGTQHDAALSPMVLVLGHGEQRAGVVIDGLPRRLKPTSEDRLEDANEPAALAGCVGDVHRIEGIDWIDLNCAALLERLQQQLAQ